MIILYYLLIYPISLLPLEILYILGKALSFIFKNIIHYRRNIINDNINRCFPNKTDEEKQNIIDGFYDYFGQFLVESIKIFSIKKNQIIKRITFENLDLILEIEKTNKTILLCGGHYANWEFFGKMSQLVFNYQVIGLYKKVTNKFMNRKIKQSRELYGSKLVDMLDFGKDFKSYINNHNIYFVADQWPSNPRRAHWTKFFGNDTAYLRGLDAYSRIMDATVVYCDISVIKKGYWNIKFELITDDPNQLKKGEIIDIMSKMLEKQIIRNPNCWLWSHKRWKHSKEEVFSPEFK